MRIAWLSPLSTGSAIGKATVQAAEEMAASAEVHLWCADRGDLHQTTTPVVAFEVNRVYEEALRTYDAVIYSFGDQYQFHREVFLMSRRVPGIAILHDYVMHHFFISYYDERPGGIELYFDTMARLYGPAARAAARASFVREGDRWRVPGSSAPLWATDRVVDYPLFEETLHRATGVVVHSEFLRQRVQQVTDAPVRRLVLPAIQRPAPDAGPRETLGVPPGRALLLTVGHVNPNKLVHEVIAALGRDPALAALVFYAVVGPLTADVYTGDLRAAISRFGLESTVRLVGRCSDEELQAWLHHADVCLTLRRPVMEGGSASLADQLALGKPVIVSDAGIYAEMPADSVIRIEAGREGERVGDVLRDLLEDPTRREDVGNRGRAYADAHAQPQRYAADLLSFIEASRGFAAMASYVDRVSAVMKQMDIQPGMPIVDAVARESANLFGDPVSSPWKPGKDEE